jgi:hypothetical protein
MKFSVINQQADYTLVTSVHHCCCLTSLAVGKHPAPSTIAHLRLSSSRYAITPIEPAKESVPPDADCSQG